MSVQDAPVRKITISLPTDLVEFTDHEAARLNISRSSLIARALAQAKADQEERLAAEGYRFYAQESAEFAEASAPSVAEAWQDAG